MVKAFISHSSKQKPIVEKIANALGHDFTIVDKYTFESGKELQEEIRSSIQSADVFMLVISDEALNSSWVIEEITWVRDLVDDDKIQFCPFIVDGTSHEDPRIKPWIRKYLLSYIDNPTLMSRIIRRRLNEVIWAKHPEVEKKARLFVGREKEMEEIISRFYENISENKRAIIVSGLSHVGRKRLLKEVIVAKIGNGLHITYEPIIVQLTDKDSIDSFIFQLNDILKKYEPDSLLRILQESESLKSVAIDLLNELYGVHERILVNDDMCIVTNQGKLIDWFVDIINDRSLISACHLFVASRCSVTSYEARKYTKIQTHQIHSLSQKHIKVLFNAYAKQKGVSLSESEVDEYLKYVSGYPEQVFAIVDSIKNFGIAYANADLPNIAKMFDDDISNLLKKLYGETEAMQLVVLLSQFDFVSYDLLLQIMDKTILDPLIAKFSLYAIFETFGSSNQFIRLNPSLVDYVGRSKIKLSSKYNYKLMGLTNALIKSTDDEALDLATQIYKLKQIISKSKSNVEKKYLLPSFALKVIYEQYNKGDYDSVIEISNTIINHKENVYNSVIRSIRYWLCLSLCRKNDKRLFDEIAYFKQAHRDAYTYHFILGFYYRNAGDYKRAEAYYESALSHTKETKASYLSKAEHELVIARMKLGKYDDALDIAKKSYEKFPMNPFNIDAYYRCYVRSSHPDVKVLDMLYHNMEMSPIPYKKYVLGVFTAERYFYVENNLEAALKRLEGLLASASGKDLKYVLTSLKEICKNRDMIPTYDSILKRNNINMYNEASIKDYE